jgi:hypothetical protein
VGSILDRRVYDQSSATVGDLSGRGIDTSRGVGVLRAGRVSVAIRRLVHSYARMPAGQEPAGKVQLDRD